LLLAACEKPDASDTTSPSVEALLGTSTGNVAYAPPEAPPSDVPNPDRWDVRLENARFSELENGAASIQVVLQMETQTGPYGFEVWLASASGTVMRWSGGSSHHYDGVVCFQLLLEDAGEALQLGEGQHTMTVAFREPDAPQALVAQSQRVAGTPPKLDGSPPSGQSQVGRTLLGCPRSVI
jgi:hypothetical protein